MHISPNAIFAPILKKVIEKKVKDDVIEFNEICAKDP